MEGLTFEEPVRKWDFIYEGNGMVMVGNISEEKNPTLFNVFMNGELVGAGHSLEEAKEIVESSIKEAYEGVKDDI